MAKKLMSLWLVLTILLFSGVPIYGGEQVQAQFYYKVLNINNAGVNNYCLNAPVFAYNNLTYLPLSADIARATGLEVQTDWNTRTVKLLKSEPKDTPIGVQWEVNGGQTLKPVILTDMKVVAATQTGVEENLDLMQRPVLFYKDTIYLPIKLFKESKTLAWDYHFDPNYGLSISSKPSVAATNYYNEAEARYNKGLVTYMKTYNKSLSDADAQKMVFAFKRAARVYGVNEVMLIAIAKRESNFHPTVVSKGGAVGLMQVMPKTGANFGAGITQLKDPVVSINIAASMLSTGMKNYNGDTIKTLSAYAYGSGRVNRGNYSTVHATSVLKLQGGIDSYLSNNGYK